MLNTCSIENATFKIYNRVLKLKIISYGKVKVAEDNFKTDLLENKKLLILLQVQIL